MTLEESGYPMQPPNPAHNSHHFWSRILAIFLLALMSFALGAILGATIS